MTAPFTQFPIPTVLASTVISPAGLNLQVQYNNGGAFGGYTNVQLTALIQPFTTSLSGAVPAPGSVLGRFLGDNGAWAFIGARVQRSITSGPVTIAGTDQILNFNLATPTSISLPTAASRSGVPLTFIDFGGQAATNNITLVATGGDHISGLVSIVLNNNYQVFTLLPANDGVNTGWAIT